jgi:hypothetical protein
MSKPTTMKQPPINMPPITDAVMEAVEQVEPVSDAAVEDVVKLPTTTELQFGIIEIPFGPLPGYVKRRVDLGRMSQKQSLTLASITSGLQFKEATLIDGTRVRSELHAIKWVLENLG